MKPALIARCYFHHLGGGNAYVASFVWGVQGGCIIRAQFLDRIKTAYDTDDNLPSLLMDPGYRPPSFPMIDR